MPKQIDRDAARAFVMNQPFKRSNTTVVPETETFLRYMTLFGHTIAMWNLRGQLCVRLSGYNTLTTRSRLNALLAAYAIPERFSRRNHKSYFGDRRIDANEWIYPQLGLLSQEPAKRGMLEEAA